MIKAIFFDLWSTLADPSNEWRHAYKAAGYERFNKEHERLFDKIINQQSFIDEEHLAKAMCESFGSNNIKKVTKLLKTERGKFYDDVIPALKDMKAKGFLLGLISNTNNVDVNAFELTIFNELIISSEVGITKPNHEIYELACKQIDVNPEQCLMVGDSPKNDIEGAKKVGMKTLLIDRKGYHPEQESIKNLNEVLDWVKNNG